MLEKLHYDDVNTTELDNSTNLELGESRMSDDEIDGRSSNRRKMISVAMKGLLGPTWVGLMHYGIKKGKEKLGKSENVKNKTESLENEALQRFDEIFDKISEIGDESPSVNGFDGVERSYTYENHDIKITISSSGSNFWKYISIKKDSWDQVTFYFLSKQWWKFGLAAPNLHIDNLTPEELINDVLPNFENRLDEAYKDKDQSIERERQERDEQIKMAWSYAQVQDQKKADDLLKSLDSMA